MSKASLLLKRMIPISESLGIKKSSPAINEEAPKVGDKCKADPIKEGDFIYGKITKIDKENGLAYSDIDSGTGEDFCGDLPTRKEDGVWVFDGF